MLYPLNADYNMTSKAKEIYDILTSTKMFHPAIPLEQHLWPRDSKGIGIVEHPYRYNYGHNLPIEFYLAVKGQPLVYRYHYKNYLDANGFYCFNWMNNYTFPQKHKMFSRKHRRFPYVMDIQCVAKKNSLWVKLFNQPYVKCGRFSNREFPVKIDADDVLFYGPDWLKDLVLFNSIILSEGL